MVDVVRAKAAAAGAGMSGRSCRAPRRSTPSRTTSSWPSSATRSTGSTAIWSPAGLRLAPAGRAPGAVLVFPPWVGEEDWQRALAATLDRWKTALGAGHRVPAGWDLARPRQPDSQVLSDAGFELAGRHEFAIEHRWTLPELAGLIRSTSFLPAAVLGDQAAAFDADLAASLGPHSNGGVFTETVSFAYELARKPA